MSNATYVVTGCAGFIGSTLVDKLISLGQRVIGIDSFNTYYDPVLKYANLQKAICKDQFTLISGELQYDTLSQLTKYTGDYLKDYIVVHLAGYPGVRPSFVCPETYIENNINATTVLLEYMRKNGMRKMVFASSSSVYGNNAVPFVESDSCRPISVYGATKLCGEGLCSAYAHAYDLSITCLRFFTCYGPRQRPDLAIRKFIENILAGKPITLYGDGSTRRDYTYVDDIVDGILRAAERLFGFDVINIGSSHPISLQSLVDKIAKLTGRQLQIERARLPAGDVLQTYADVEKALHKLTWEPKTDIDLGLAQFIKWLESNASHSVHGLARP